MSSEVEPTARQQRPVRTSILWLCGILGLAAIAVLVVASRHRSSSQQEVAPTQDSATIGTNEVIAPVAEPIATAPISTAPATATINSDRSARARELIKRMGELQPSGVTPETATRWRQDMEQLIEQGTAAVAPLEAFFQSGADVRFDPAIAKLLGESTLRIAFIEVLSDLPTPDNVDLQARLLRDTSDPAEVAVLARQLEAQEPGKYQPLILYAAQVSLEQAGHGQWPGRDTLPLRKIIKANGAANAQ